MTMSDTANASNQARTQDTSGGNLVGKNPTPPQVRQPPKVLGKSGQGDNQSTSRPKGST